MKKVNEESNKEKHYYQIDKMKKESLNSIFQQHLEDSDSIKRSKPSSNLRGNLNVGSDILKFDSKL